MPFILRKLLPDSFFRQIDLSTIQVWFKSYSLLAEGPGVAHGKKNLKKKFRIFLAYVTPRPPLSVHNKFQPNRSSRLAGYREHIYEFLVLLYR